MNKKTISSKRAKEIESAWEGRIRFEILNNKVVGLDIHGPGGQPPVFVRLDSYSVEVCELDMKEVFCLDVDGTTHEFDTFEERRDFIYGLEFGANIYGYTRMKSKGD